jgi:hypothetical protein
MRLGDEGAFMPVLTEKDILASVSRLRGASAAEVAADLGVSQAELMPMITELADRGYVSPLWPPQLRSTSGREQFDPEELGRAVLRLTHRGTVELR